MKLLLIFGVGLQLISIQQNGNAQQFYIESHNKKTWHDAYDACLEMGMELAILNSQTDFDAAVNYILESFTGSDHIWIGYRIKDHVKGIFEWINGEENHFTQWGPSDPNNLVADSCVRLIKSTFYVFADESCSHVLNYLCTEGSVPTVYTTETNIHAPIMSTVTLECSYRSLWDVTDVLWQKRTEDTAIILNQSHSNTTYSGGTVAQPSLVITNMKLEREGTYRCLVGNTIGLGEGRDIALYIEPGPPMLQPATAIYCINKTDRATFTCETEAYPEVIAIEWMKDSGGKVTMLSAPPLSTSFSIENAKVDDGGIYMCNVSNGEWSVAQSFTLHVKEDMCPCSCEYKEKLKYWSSQNATNYTLEELKEILAPITEQIRKELLVDTTTLSSTINKLISKNDDRPSAKGMGYIGITFLSFVLFLILFADLASLCMRP